MQKPQGRNHSPRALAAQQHRYNPDSLGEGGCGKPAWNQTIQALSTNGSLGGASEHRVALHFKGLSTEKSRPPLPGLVLGCISALGSYMARISRCLARARRRDQ